MEAWPLELIASSYFRNKQTHRSRVIDSLIILLRRKCAIGYVLFADMARSDAPCTDKPECRPKKAPHQ